MKKVLSFEEHFLLMLMEFDIAPGKRDELIAHIKYITNWQKVARVAITSGMAPLFYKNLQTLNLKELVPAEVFQKFKNQYIQTLFKNTQRIKAFEVIIAELNKKNIDFIPLKGIYLAPSLYQDLGLRTMCDIDFMVRIDDVENCKEALLKLGWRVKEIHKTDHIKSLNVFHTPYVFLNDGMMIELHQKLYESGTDFDMPADELWAKSIKQVYLNGESYQLNFEDLLLHQILHLYKHFIAGQHCFKSFVDIVSLIKNSKNEFNRQAFSELIEKYNCQQEVAVINSVLKSYFSLEIYAPAENPKSTTKIDVDLIFRSLLNGENKNAKDYLEENKIEYISDKKRLKHIKGLKQKITYVLGNVFPDKNFMYRRYKITQHHQLLYYYPYRILSLLKNKKNR